MTLSRRAKVWLALLASTFVICSCCSGFGLNFVGILGQSFTFEAEQANEIGQEIINYTLPEGYTELGAVDWPQSQSVIIMRPFNTITETGSMMILLTEVANPASTTRADLERQQQEILNAMDTWQNTSFRYDSTETRLINGEKVDITIRVGETGAGIPSRQTSGVVQGKNGFVFILAQGTEASWDQAALDKFLNSMR